MVYEMSVVFTVCCVAPPGVRNEIRYQLTNPLNVICFRTDILRPSYNPSSGSHFFCVNHVWSFVSFPSSFFFSKNKTIIYRYLYSKKFVVNQEIIYLLSLTNFPTIWSTLKRSRFIHFSITLRKEILYSLIPSKIKFREDWNVKIDFSEKFPYVEEISRSYAFLHLPKRMCKLRNITLPCSIVRCLSITWRMVRQ